MTESLDCPVCAFAAEHHYWPMPGTHCKDCHRSWTSLSQAHCITCHEQFATNGVSDRHWIKGHHIHPSFIAEAGDLVLRDEAAGPVYRSPSTDSEWFGTATSASV
jgi:RNA polymerase subunit RPABC4/transcription elongation factor Spt4